MSEYIPFEIQLEIMKRLPVKSLIQFRSVSKQWKSSIDSSDFISGYGVRHPQPHSLLLRYTNHVNFDENYVSFVDDDQTFTQQEFAPCVPLLTNLLENSRVVGSSHGLLCLYGCYATHMVVIWNPCIKKSIGIELPVGLNIVIGFGVCPISNDPTIVKISSSQVEIFTLSSGIWQIPSSNLPRESIRVTWPQVVIDRFIYWAAYDKIVTINDRSEVTSLIVSFDLTTKEFKAIDLPNSPEHQFQRIHSISKLRESLVMLEYNIEVEEPVCFVWMMEQGVTQSFKKLFTIDIPGASVNKLLGFSKSDELIIVLLEEYERFSTLKLYEPSSHHITDLGINGEDGYFFMSSYMESLLLLDQPDCYIYSIIN